MRRFTSFLMHAVPGSPEERLDTGIENIDAIVLQAADILYECEKDLAAGSFNIDAFEEKITQEFDLDPTRKLLLGRAMERYRQAIEYTEQNGGDLTGILESTKLNLPAYQSIRASMDPQRPGVMVIHLKDGKDAAQFNRDTEGEVAKSLRENATPEGLVTEDREPRGFIGLSIDLKTLGLPETLPVLGVIVVCDDVGKNAEKEGVTNHEYAHALYKRVVQPFLHKYLSGAGFTEEAEFTAWTTRFTGERREKLFAALGDFSTNQLDRFKAEVNAPPRKSRQHDRWAALGVKVSTPKESLEREYYDTLFEEQKLLDELRAYGFSHPAGNPLPSPTCLQIRPFTRAWESYEKGVMDPKMVNRYFRLHFLLFRAHYRNPDLHLRAMSIAGTAQTLDQATRLIQPLLEASPWVLPSKEDFDDLMLIIRALQTPGVPPPYAIDRKDGEALIPNHEMVQILLPPVEIFRAAVERYYSTEKPADVQEVEKNY